MIEKVFTVDKFLGINEAADGTTELKMGEASIIENFMITDGYNLQTRPGIQRMELATPAGGTTRNIVDAVPVYLGAEQWLICLQDIGAMRVAHIYHNDQLMDTISGGYIWKVFVYDGVPHLLYSSAGPEGSAETDWALTVIRLKLIDGALTIERSEPYSPLVRTETPPTGGSIQLLEPLNILSESYRDEFKADGEAAQFALLSFADDVLSVAIGNAEYKSGENLAEIGSYDADSHTFTFQQVPAAGEVIVFSCKTSDADNLQAKRKFLFMPHYQFFNGATDARMFFYGDGSNIAYYTGLPAMGDGFYLPSGNELAVDFSGSPITSMVRHYSRLLVYKPDGVDVVTYEPLELADNSVIAGFYLTPVNRNFGNDAPGQVQLINNSPRSFTHSGIYEWRVSSGYQDERYAKCISQKVSKTIATADLSKLVAFDDEVSKTYYIFLNDDDGTVLVNRYDLEVWSIFKSLLTKSVTKAFMLGNKVVLLSAGELFTFSKAATFDAPVIAGNEMTRIGCVWESGYMAFGADYRRKHSSNLWISMLPEENSRMTVTVQTDRRDDYLEKELGQPLLDFRNISFSNFSFLRSLAPQIKRIKLKVKKFVYYKLIFRVAQNAERAGDRATILGYDQQVRYSSDVK